MEQEKILMGQKQLQRWHLMKMVEVGKITLKEASERIGVSYRQAKGIGRANRGRGGRPSVGGGVPNIASDGSEWLKKDGWCFGMEVPIPGLAQIILLVV